MAELLTSFAPDASGIARNYDTQRRLQAAHVLALALGSMLVLFTLVLTGFLLRSRMDNFQTYVMDGVLAFCVLLFMAGYYAVSLSKVTLAGALIIVATNLAIISFEVLWSLVLKNGLDPIILVSFAAGGFSIVLAGILGDTWMIFATALTMNILVLSLALFAPSVHTATASPASLQALIEQERVLFTLTIMLMHWVFAAIAMTTARIYHQTLGDVGQAYAEAKQLESLKDQFITNVNHELRTPIMTLQGYVEYLRLARDQMSPEEEGIAFEKASRIGDGLVSLLSSILDVRHIDKGLDDFTPAIVPVQAALEQAMMLINPQDGSLTNRPLQITIPEGLAVWGDAVRLQQILTNLLSNAIKYSAPDTAIEVEARSSLIDHRSPGTSGWWRRGTITERPTVEITVRDYGLGIPPEQIPLLFHRFARLPRDLASTVIGNGLGLYLCNALAISMRGRIWVESKGIKGEGSTFHLVLPLVLEQDHAQSIARMIPAMQADK